MSNTNIAVAGTMNPSDLSNCTVFTCPILTSYYNYRIDPAIFLQNWDKCVFKAEFPKGLEDRHSACVVRLDAENENLKTFTTIAPMQQIAATIIPEPVPQTLQVGEAKNAQGRMFHFSVIELVERDLLEDVWQQMSAEEQSSVVAGLEWFTSKTPTTSNRSNIDLTTTAPQFGKINVIFGLFRAFFIIWEVFRIFCAL